jgi:hypothetical protein
MKRIFILAVLLLSFAYGNAQSPQKMSFQAVIRNSSNSLVSNLPIGLRVSILQGTPSGAVVYSETQTANTNVNGLVTIQIGGGNVIQGDFSTIEWANGPYFIQTETDVNGGANYTITSTTQLLSVPYALYAQTSGSSPPGPQGLQGVSGTNGTNGVDGAQGPQGPAGQNGTNGQNGLSAYQIWLNAGNTGTEAQFLIALQGTTGAQGPDGINGANGIDGATGPQGIQGLTGAAGPQGIQGSQGIAGTNGINGVDGAQGPQGPAGQNGINGQDGLSAYQIWLNAGNTGNETQFLSSLQGATGPQGIQGLTGLQGPTGPTGTSGLQGPAGADGINGTDGTNGTNGLSAYQIWMNLGNIGTEADFIASLNGPQGVQGPAGANGVDGKNTLIKTSIEPAGANCVNGGTKIEIGLDENDNGILNTDEIDTVLTNYLCNNSTANIFNPLLGYKIGFNSSNNWICPFNVKKIKVELWGAAGGAAKTLFSTISGCSGTGGNGGYNSIEILTVPNNIYSITIGQGGVEGNVVNNNWNNILIEAQNGEQSNFNNILFAQGGLGGKAKSASFFGGPTQCVYTENGGNAQIENFNYTQLNAPSYIPSNYFVIPTMARGGYYRFNPSGFTEYVNAENGFCLITILETE